MLDVFIFVLLLAGFLLAGVAAGMIERLLGTTGNDLAHAIFRSMVGLGDAERGDRLTQLIVERKFAYERIILRILQRPGLLAANVGTWGSTAIEFLAGLVNAKQK